MSRSESFVRILESQYKAELAAEFERGRASASVPPITAPTAPSGTASGEAARLAAIDAIGLADMYPEIVRKGKADGSSPGAVAHLILVAHAATKTAIQPGSSAPSMVKPPAFAPGQVRSKEEDEKYGVDVQRHVIAIRIRQREAAKAGERLSASQASMEIQQEAEVA